MLYFIPSVVLILAGALVYALASNPKAAEIGRLMLLAGLIALAFGAGAAGSGQHWRL